MLHKGTGVEDQFEVLCSIPELVVKRIRFRRTSEVSPAETGEKEVLIAVLGGRATVALGERQEHLSAKDVCYLPMGIGYAIHAEPPADVVIAEAPAANAYPVAVRPIAKVEPIQSGLPTYSRKIFTSFGEKDQANRLIAGFVEGASGNWTSFPPHRHDGKPEVYVYYGMGERFGVQIVAGEEEMAYVVREGDAVLFESGYHPNVATPGVGMNFLWIISADPKERNLSVELHPQYKDLPMGQTHLSTK